MAHLHAKLMIVGSGPAGYTAAIYAARAMLEPVMISGFQPGGQLMITTDVENYPGFADVIQGPWLMEQMRLQAAHVGTKIVTDMVTKLELGSRPFRLTCDSGDVYLADTVILLRYFEFHGEVRQAISVVKKRAGAHDHTIREARVEPGGLFVGEPLRDFQGVLTGVPTYTGNNGELMRKKKS